MTSTFSRRSRKVLLKRMRFVFFWDWQCIDRARCCRVSGLHARALRPHRVLLTCLQSVSFVPAVAPTQSAGLKLMVNLISAMNASFPEHDFSSVGSDCFTVAKVESVRQRKTQTPDCLLRRAAWRSTSCYQLKMFAESVTASCFCRHCALPMKICRRLTPRMPVC